MRKGDRDEDGEDDGIDELQELNETERDQMLKSTAVVRGTVAKVCVLGYHSLRSTIASKSSRTSMIWV